MKRLLDYTIIGYLVINILYWLKLLPFSSNIINTIYFSKESLFIGLVLISCAYNEFNRYRMISMYSIGVMSLLLTVFFIYDYEFKILFINYFAGYMSSALLVLILIFYLLSKYRKI